jgi:hypothetical protein
MEYAPRKNKGFQNAMRIQIGRHKIVTLYFATNLRKWSRPASSPPMIRPGPDHWQEFGTRRSRLSNTSRRPPNPANAILNYLYTLLESETRLAINALGLDPGFGLLHLDHGVRDNLVYDMMEPIPPKINAYVFEWISGTLLKRSWFFEERDGSCRLMSDLTVQLSDTASTWAGEVAPIAEWYAETLSASLSDKEVPAASTRLTRRRRYAGQGSVAPEIKPARKQQSTCSVCGKIVTPGNHFCHKCALEQSGKRLAEASKLGFIAASSPEVIARIKDKMRTHREAIRNWNPQMCRCGLMTSSTRPESDLSSTGFQKF